MVWADVLIDCKNRIAIKKKELARLKHEISKLHSAKRFFQEECDTSGMTWEEWVKSLNRNQGEGESKV